MQTKFNKVFPNVVVLGTTNGKERELILSERLKNNNINYEIYNASPLPFYTYIFNNIKENTKDEFRLKYLKHPDELAITTGHLNIIRMAKDKDWDSVFIFENDTTFRKDFNESFDTYIDHLPKDWDMVYLTLTVFNESGKEDINDYWIKPKYCPLASAYVIKSSMYDVILDFYKSDYFVIDLFYTFILQQDKRFKIYGTKPNLCAQSRTTDIHSDYNPLDAFDMSINFGDYKIEDYL